MSNYNFIYRQLVKAPNDVVGALAYALYKHEKVEYIAKFKQQHNNADPSDKELAHFHLTSTTEARIGSYQQSAEALLNNFLTEVLTEAIEHHQEQVEQSMYMRALRRAKVDIGKQIDSKHSFLRGVWQNVIAGFVTTLITFGIILGAWMMTVGPDNMFWTVVDHLRDRATDLKPETKPNPSPDQALAGLGK
ncbi:hypothetical protein [Alcaligenes sp. SMD-FA]|uniref:hypothetical protein n=1 Tax=Alcaligenes sp. SMD-FA TaxID=2991054 RepID=UPI00222745F4|nr:hypothetical protein [Alcaligenes sp. SMD-FA]UYY88127.1 hypothetical protein OKX01_04265 [Alcaligenes sp. SMD-FA]